MKELAEILETARKRGASDVHITSGAPIWLRIDGALAPLSDDTVQPEEIEELIRPMLSDEQAELLKKEGGLEISYSLPEISCLRVSLLRQQGAYALAIRIPSAAIPAPKELGLPLAAAALTEKKRGLVLVTGTAGSGKTTTLASLLEAVAERGAKKIITVEQPVEYLHRTTNALVLQCEIGADCPSYASALRGALRQDADVILLGELPDTETMEAALAAAERGVLVLAETYAADAVSTLERLIGAFLPERQQQICTQLAETLCGVIAERLLPRESETGAGGRAAAFEVLLANETVCNLIREGKIRQLPAAIQNFRKEGMQSMDDAVYELYMRSVISSETAVAYAKDPADMQRKVQLF